MKYTAILFDMDGTILPMDQDAFVKAYFKLLAKFLAQYGVDPQLMLKGMNAGVQAMFENDGSCTNDEAFWPVFSGIAKADRVKLDEMINEFYMGEFNEAKAFAQENPLAEKVIRLAKKKSRFVVLATQPVFPRIAQAARMSWVNVQPDMFDMITSYNTDRWCKPRPEYYTSICERIGVDPEECLMIGNDVKEDMIPASSIGMDCYLVTDTKIEDTEHPWTGKRGTFAELMGFLAEAEEVE